jgi:hypothetical protein
MGILIYNSMDREDKIKLAIDKGFKCNPETGEVIGLSGKVITGKSSNGYINISFNDNKKLYSILAHQFIYYWVNNKCVDFIDHINMIKDDNRAVNLRSVTRQQNMFNTGAKGYYWKEENKKWISSIHVNDIDIYLGSFNTEEEASQAYQDNKKIYHRI